MNPAAPVTNSFIPVPLPAGSLLDSSLDVDLTMIADHQAHRPRLALRARHHRIAPDQAVFQAGDVDDLAVLHDHRVFDLGMADLASRTDGAERADEAVDHDRTGADRHRTSDRRVDDLGARLDDDPTVDDRVVVDTAVDA